MEFVPRFFGGESEKFFIAFFCVSPEADIVDAVARDRYMSVHEAGWPHFSVVNPIAEIELEKKTHHRQWYCSLEMVSLEKLEISSIYVQNDSSR